MRSDYYLEPFDKDLWFALLSVILIGTSCVITAQNLIRNGDRPLIDNLFLAFETLINQCGNEDMKSISLRLICLFLRIIALITIGLYGATVTSFLAVESFKVPFKNREGFLKNGEFQLLLPDKANDTLSVNADK